MTHNKHTEMIQKWLVADTDDLECLYCYEKGELALDFVSLVVGCGKCGEMGGVDYKTGQMHKGEEIEWYCYCCSLMFPTGGERIIEDEKGQVIEDSV